MDDSRHTVRPSRTVGARFLARAAAFPAAVAIRYGDESWTYAALEKQSAFIASALVRKGARPGDCVAILAERNPQLIASIIGATRLGCAFVVLDSAYPAERIETLLSLVRPDFLLGSGGHEISKRGAVFGESAGIAFLDVATVPSRIEALVDLSAEPLDEETPAYFLFTSGSTGKPKCVALPHAPLNHFIDWHVLHGSFESTDTFSMTAGLSHDPLLRDIFTPLSIGATLAIPNQSMITQPGRLRQWFKDQAITVSHLTPAMGQLLVAGSANAPRLDDLRHVFWGGDQLQLGLVRTLKRVAPHTRQTNFYGCTETPQAIAYYDIEGETLPERLPIGKAVEGFELSVVLDSKQAVPDGVTGELLIRSPYLSLGYVTNGIVERHAEPGIYYTGDRATRQNDQNFILNGRGDDQIKVRGFRVDLSEITQGLLASNGVSSAIALSTGEGNHSRILGFVALTPGAQVSEQTIFADLAARLPSYMVPNQLVLLKGGLPLLPNGKTDRQALLRMATVPAAAGNEAPCSASPAEATLIEAWAKLFPDRQITPRTSFVSLGGDSLSYVQTYLATEEALGVVPGGWVEQSISDLAKVQKTRSKFWGSVDATMAIRCVAIVMIVGFHFGLCPPGNGLTGAFFLVSGFMFASLQLKEMLAQGDRRPLLSSMRNIFIPAAVFTGVTAIVDLFAHVKTPLPTLLFFADWTDGNPFLAPSQPLIRHEVVFWYVDCLLQMLLLIYGVMTGCEKLLKRRVDAPTLSLSLLLVGLVGRFALPALNQHPFPTQLPELSLFQLAPFSNIATFALGMYTFTSVKPAKRLWMFAAIAAFCLVDGHLYGLNNGIAIALAAALLIFVERVTVPRVVAGAVFTLSAASLYIYLTQFIFSGVVDRLLHKSAPLAEAAAALVGGIIVHKLWQLASQGPAQRAFSFVRQAFKPIFARVLNVPGSA